MYRKEREEGIVATSADRRLIVEQNSVAFLTYSCSKAPMSHNLVDPWEGFIFEVYVEFTHECDVIFNTNVKECTS
jgi:hypothetical protein